MTDKEFNLHTEREKLKMFLLRKDIDIKLICDIIERVELYEKEFIKRLKEEYLDQCWNDENKLYKFSYNDIIFHIDKLAGDDLK